MTEPMKGPSTMTNDSERPSAEGDVRPMRVFLSPLTGRAYATNDYDDAGPLRGFVANSKHDVTDDVVRDLMAAAWARGWNECNAAAAGEAAPNPYRPIPPATPEAGA